jgi:hypothetical protein
MPTLGRVKVKDGLAVATSQFDRRVCRLDCLHVDTSPDWQAIPRFVPTAAAQGLPRGASAEESGSVIRHRKLIIAVVGMLALAGLGIGLAVGLSGAPPSASAAVTFTTPQQVRLEQGITAPTVTAQANIVATEVRSQFEDRGKPLLTAGSRLSITASTFHAISAQIATVDAIVSGPHAGRWQLVLVHETGRWLLIGTRKLP